jgi:hypothetical protein
MLTFPYPCEYFTTNIAHLGMYQREPRKPHKGYGWLQVFQHMIHAKPVPGALQSGVGCRGLLVIMVGKGNKL